MNSILRTLVLLTIAVAGLAVARAAKALPSWDEGKASVSGGGIEFMRPWTEKVYARASTKPPRKAGRS